MHMYNNSNFLILQTEVQKAKGSNFINIFWVLKQQDRKRKLPVQMELVGMLCFFEQNADCTNAYTMTELSFQ